MCMEFAKECECGQRKASFHFQDNVMPPEVISRLLCPFCDADIELDVSSSVKDNGWAIEYNMELVEFSGANLPTHNRQTLSPAVLFDEGYASWRGIYPGDHIDSAKEREELIKLAKTDIKQYMEKMKSWATSRMTRLAEDGWRKANAA